MSIEEQSQGPSVLLSTPHGSHLYGLATPESDLDFFKVIADNPTVKGKYARQKIYEVDDDTYDETVTDMSTFAMYAGKGVPQYLEAMWSPQATGDEIHDWRMAFSPDYYKTQDTYIRTILNFYEEQTIKKKRHAYRLVLNLLDLRENGIFDPTLDEEHLERLDHMVKSDPEPLEYLE